MTTTIAAPTTIILDWAQLQPICQVDQITHGVHHGDCINPAAWLGIPPCGHDGFFCEQHHYDSRSFICRQCGNMTLLAVYRWVRL